MPVFRYERDKSQISKDKMRKPIIVHETRQINSKDTAPGATYEYIEHTTRASTRCNPTESTKHDSTTRALIYPPDSRWTNQRGSSSICCRPCSQSCCQRYFQRCFQRCFQPCFRLCFRLCSFSCFRWPWTPKIRHRHRHRGKDLARQHYQQYSRQHALPR